MNEIEINIMHFIVGFMIFFVPLIITMGWWALRLLKKMSHDE